MQWDATTQGGFTSGEPWLPVVDPDRRNVASQREDERSLLNLYRRLLRLRPRLGVEFEVLPADRDVLAYRRGRHVVALNLGHEDRAAPPGGDIVLATADDALQAGRLAPHSGVVQEAA